MNNLNVLFFLWNIKYSIL